MKNLIFPIFFFLSTTLFAQISDDFEDGDISDWTQSSAGTWDATTDNPLNGTYSLQHVADGGNGEDQISLPFSGIDITSGTTTWQFQVKHDYSPSGYNNWAFFLFADADALEMYNGGNINGYAAGVNFTGSDDIFYLWKISEGALSVVVNTEINWENTVGTNPAGIKITRSSDGNWTVELDTDGGFDNLVEVGNGTDTDFSTANFLGIFYEFSSTHVTDFRADDISVTGPPDTTPPIVISAEAVSDNTIIVNFNENLDQTTAENLANYTVDGGIGNPVSATLNTVDNKQTELTFAGTFTDNTNYTLTVDNVEDVSGNACSGETVSFSYVQIAAVSASPVSSNTLDVFFSKKVDEVSAQNTSNYSVDNGIGNPSSAVVDTEDNKIVHLSFASDFVSEQDYTLSVENIEDIYGNTADPANLPFSYYEVKAFDIVVNEIMNDVNPAPEAIPAHEYIEIYNNSGYDINLSGWTLTIGTDSPKIFPAKTIAANGYAIICEDIAESDFSPYGITIGILNPSELTITDKRIQIKNSEDLLIEDITYSQDWYHDTDKDDGGWSMERIDPANFCGGEDNWIATEDYTGGTPGRQNSVYANNPDNTSPSVTSIVYVSSKELQINFSEKVKIEEAENVSYYTLNFSINPVTAISDPDDASKVNIVFAENFPEGSNNLEISNISDNCDNVMSSYSGNFEYYLIYPVSVEVMSANQLRIHFSEKIDVASGENTANYFVNGGIGNPQAATIGTSDDKTINLLFSSDFIQKQEYTVSVENVKDINGNIMNESNLDFIYYVPAPFDVIINEIMADVNPAPVSLPAERYVELYNTSEYDIDLTNWIFLSEGQTERVFPYITLKSGEYLILCEEESEPLFSPYGTVVPILTSSDIIASGRNLKVMMPDQTVVEELTYSDEWYGNTDKDNGGWSLERIDPANFCGEENNWRASEDPAGGTPGQRNSVYAINRDNLPPDIVDVKIVSSNYLILNFTENINYATASDIYNFSVNNGIGNPETAYLDEYDRTKVHLLFSGNFTDKQNYELIIENISDNCGNIMQTTGYDFTYHKIYLKELWVKDEKRLKLVFSETPEFVSAVDVSNYFCDGDTGNPEFAVRETLDSAVVHLQFSDNFPDGETLNLKISGIKDINGNYMNDTTLSFLFYIPKPNDIVINEVLFNPFPEGNDFVELYNRSDYDIDLINLKLASEDPDFPDSIISVSPLSSENKYFKSGTYSAFTLSTEGVLRFYMSRNSDNIFELPEFPSYPDDEGTVVLLYKDTAVIDKFSYNEDMHLPLLDDNEGVSLERVNYDKPTQDESNWHSASELVGFATPAYKNSQFSENPTPVDTPIDITPHVFSPDNDGYNDYANINFKFDTPDNLATIYIFDAKGRIIKTLANNLLLSTEGTVVWDGTEENGSRAAAGTYIVYFKVFDVNGNTEAYKLSVVLAKKM
ncbi:MAG: hypothetical protein GXO50_03970 [Chlorobi bacterium]|nr:hypothetical protein [Chlorobiota bacterium]